MRFPVPSALRGDVLVDELAAAGYPNADVFVHGDSLVVAGVPGAEVEAVGAVVAAHPDSAASADAVDAAARSNESTIRNRAEQALATNADFLALVSPSNAQTLAQVKALTRQTNGLIRLVLGRLESAD